MRTIYAHLSELRNRHAALRLQRAADGNMIIVFNETFLPAKKPSSNCKSLHLPDQEEEEEINLQDESLLLLDDHDSDHDHSAETLQNSAKTLQNSAKTLQNSAKTLQNSAKTLQNSAKTPRLSAQFAAELRAAGVFASLMGEIAASGRTEEDLRALLAWARDEQPESPAALFIARMRAGACAPARFYQPPCPHCGKYGGHAEDCTGKPSRFLGQYADYLED